MNLSSLIVIVICAWFIGRPLWSDKRVEAPNEEVLLQERERLILELREMELDFGLGKMSGPDYERFRSLLSDKLVKVLSELQENASR